MNATRDFDDYHPTDEELNELKDIIRDTKDLTRGELCPGYDNNISSPKKPGIQNKNNFRDKTSPWKLATSADNLRRR